MRTRLSSFYSTVAASRLLSQERISRGYDTTTRKLQQEEQRRLSVAFVVFFRYTFLLQAGVICLLAGGLTR